MLGDGNLQLLEALARVGADLDRHRQTVVEPFAILGRDEVDLVEHDDLRQLGGADLFEHIADGAHLLVALFLIDRTIDDVHEQVAGERLLERRGKRVDEAVRQLANKTDGVRNRVIATDVLELTGRWVERLEEPVATRHLGTREGVKEAGLAHICIAGERHGRHHALGALLALQATTLARLLDSPPEQRDAIAGKATVGLELRLARTAGTDAATKALKVVPHAAHTGQLVLELGELDLELALCRVGVAGEDVQDQRRAVDHANRETVLEIPLLRRRQLVVDHQDLGLGLLDALLQLVDFAAAEIGLRFGLVLTLDQFADRVALCRQQQLA